MMQGRYGIENEEQRILLARERQKDRLLLVRMYVLFPLLSVVAAQNTESGNLRRKTEEMR